MILRRLLLFILFILITLGAALFYIGSESGTRTVWNILSDKYSDQISAGKVEGRLGDKIFITDLKVNIDNLDLTVDKFEFSWHPSKLFQKELLIEQIKIDGLLIDDNRPEKTETDPIELSDIELPLQIKIKSFLLTQAEYRSPSLEKALQLDQLSFAFDVDKNRMKLAQLQAKMMDAEVKISGLLQPRDNYPLDFTISWKATLPDLPILEGSGKVHGDLENLIIAQQLDLPATIYFDANLKQPLADLNWSASLLFDDLKLQNIKADLPSIMVELQTLAHGNLKQIHLTNDYTITSEEYGTWDGALLIDQTIVQTKVQKTPAEIDIKAFTLRSRDTDAHADIKGLIKLNEPPEIALQGNWYNLRWPLTGEAIASTDQGEFHVTGNSSDYQLQIKTHVNQAQVGDVVLDLNGHGDSKHFVIEKLLSDLLSGQFNTQGDVNWGSIPLTFDLNGDWKDIIWQQIDADNPQQIKSPQGNFKLKGQPDQYVINLETALDGDQIPTGNWIISGTGSSSDFNLESLHGDVLDGVIELAGKVGWDEKLTWDIKLDGQNINPELLQKDWPGKLDLSAKISGQQVGDQTSASLENTLIKGKLRGYPFKAQTDLKIINNALDIKQLHLSSGKSVLKASGHAGEKLDLNWTLESPDLAELYPEAGGQLSAQGTIKGAQAQPSINATLKGKKIVVPGIQFGKLDSIVKLDLAQGEKFDIQLNSSQIKLGENIIDKLDLTGTGKLSAHTIKANIISAQGNLHFLSKGGLKDDRWNGIIQELTLEEKKFGRWQLATPEKLIASKQKADLEKLCLTQKEASLCLGAHWKASGAWQINSDIDQLPLSILGPFLPTDIVLDSTVSSKLNASGTGNKNIRAKLDLNAPAGTIHLQNADDRPQFKYDKAALNIVMNDQGAKASLLFDLVQPTDSPVKATLETPPFDLSTVDFNKLPLKGRVTTKVDDLGFIQTFTHELEELKGNLDVDLRIAGTVSKPKIEGHTKLVADFFLPSAGIHLQDVKIDAISHDARTLAFNGQARSGEGKLDLKGTVGLAEDGFPINAEINGDRFELANLPEAWVLISPKLKISQYKNSLNIEGEVTIPEAKLEPQGIASSVPLSDDVTIINDPNLDPDTVKETKQKTHVSTYVKVILGNKISISASGFTGSLKGDLLVTGKPKKPIMGTGEIIIYDGLFSAYGQELDIDKGRIIFAGGPIDSPTLDLKAIRKIKNKKITAGVHVTGAATSPELTLFSKPSMNQDNILSYLMIGKPLSEATSGDGDILIGAATSLGFKGGAMLTDTIGQSLGLDEFSLGGDGAEDASLQIGKYLTPKLYISYGVGLFEPVTQLKMRYDFSKRWSMEAESGTNSGMDFLYKIEK